MSLPAPSAPQAPARADTLPSVTNPQPQPQPRPSDEAEADEQDNLARSLGRRLRRLSPVVVILSIGSLGTMAVGLWALLSHTSPIGLLVSAGVVAGIVFALDTIAAAVATYRAGQDGETVRALLLACLGGATSMISAVAFAGALVLVLLLNP